MDGFERRRERKKESIRKAALELFSAHGVQKVSIAEIAQKAKVSQVTIYNYFGSKDELLKQVILFLLYQRLQQDTEVIESDRPFPEKIESYITEKTSELSSMNPDFLLSMQSDDPSIRSLVKDFAKNEYIPLLVRLIEKGREEGYIHHEISNEAILIYINMFRDLKNQEGVLDIQQHKDLLRELVTLFFYGIFSKKAEK